MTVGILLALAVATEVVAVAGVVAAATAVDRLHYAGTTTAIAPFLVAAAVIVEEGTAAPTWNAVFVAFALVVLNATVTHATARVARQRSSRDVQL